MAWCDFITCACGKRGYPSRKEARRAARSQSMGGMNAYRCTHPACDPVYLWHFGHLPPSVKASRVARDTLGTTAPRPVPRRARG